ncbi:wax synthase family protein [Aspergillus lucknowensis]|uniref:Wax synthase domain-containing protein n=1 Tax=Aspergillus lucknowensis TaxID=176173 RepID=A0ABR4M1E3_9EURO
MTTIILVGAFLFADEKVPLSPSLKNALYLTTIASSVIASTLYSPTSLTILNYANAFLSVAYALRAIELLILSKPGQLTRLERVNAASAREYAWKPMPPTLSPARLLAVCNLLINPRGIGWAHGSRRYLPQLEKLNASSQNGSHPKPEEKRRKENEKFVLKDKAQSRLPFLAKEAFKLFIAYLFPLILDVTQTPAIREYNLGLQLRPSPQTSAKLVRRFLLPPACWAACYAFIDGIHAAVALIDVGGLYLVLPALASDPWMYPPVFGPWRYIFWPRLKDIWGKLWHDLCRRALISGSTVLIPRRSSVGLRRALVGFLSFVISGVVHAAGTYAVSKDLHAVLMIMVFFTLLPLFLALQEAVSVQILERFLPDFYITRAIIWVLDAAYIICWGYHTAPLFFKYSMIPESLVSVPVPAHWSFWEGS